MSVMEADTNGRIGSYQDLLVWKAAIELANAKVYRRGKRDWDKRGMGATIAALFVSGDAAVTISGLVKLETGLASVSAESWACT
jgi:serine/threonine protein phosphatase PrpC